MLHSLATRVRWWLARWDRTGARCKSLDRFVSPARPPNRTCDFHRIRLSHESLLATRDLLGRLPVPWRRDRRPAVAVEEFGQWEDARRGIDLLAIDRDAHLVVIELKLTTEGGHMELQALRYAAMVSSMRFEEVATAYAAHLARHRPGDDPDARSELLAWLDAPDGAEDVAISSNVRIVLVSEDFGREITTTVLWLNRFDGMDIRCVRLVPYEVDGRVLLDVQQVVPLPEAADYQVRLRRKDQQQERVSSEGRDFTRYHIVVDGQVLPDENKRRP